ncbi:hypothetical protein PTKIN_Ptkin19aG0082000 [Pterospermum kingtungense]
MEEQIWFLDQLAIFMVLYSSLIVKIVSFSAAANKHSRAIRPRSSSIHHDFKDVRVTWDQRTGCSRGFSFVSFHNEQVLFVDVQSAIDDFSGKMGAFYSMHLRSAGGNDDKQNFDAKSVVGAANLQVTLLLLQVTQLELHFMLMLGGSHTFNIYN